METLIYGQHILEIHPVGFSNDILTNFAKIYLNLSVDIPRSQSN